MDKFSFIGLWDVYSGLLTGTQREITDMYFNLDLTVSEIAAEKGISRQAVSDCLKGCKNQLEEYEGKLHFFERLQKAGAWQAAVQQGAEEWIAAQKALRPELADELEKLSRILHTN